MIGNQSITFGQPWWLILLPLILPPLVWMSFRSLAGLGAYRGAMAILLRAGVITLIVLALAEMQTVRRTMSKYRNARISVSGGTDISGASTGGASL